MTARDPATTGHERGNHDNPLASRPVSFLGIDVGGTRIKWARLVCEKVVDRGDVATRKAGGEELVAQIAELIASVGPDADAAGLAVPGLVDTVNRETLFIPNIPGAWASYPLGRAIENRTGMPVLLLNDARAFGYAEFHLGAGRDATDALFITIGTGIGGAIASNGNLVVADIDSYPEVGHMAVEMHGERCGCGGTGCLETVASASAIVAASMRALVTGQSPVLTALCGGQVENLTAEQVAKAADSGDPWALAAFARAGTFLGMAAASCCVVMSASKVVVVGGGLAGAFHHLAPAIEAITDQRRSLIGDVDIRPAALGSHAGSIGAALFAQHGVSLNPGHAAPGEHPRPRTLPLQEGRKP